MIRIFILDILFLLFFVSSAISSEALFGTIRNSDLDGFNQAKEKITDWDIKDGDGSTLILLAFQTLNKLDKANRGKTALHYAVMNNDIPMVRMLIEKGANVNVKDENDDTPYLLARKLKYHEIADLIFDKLKKVSSNDIPAGKTDNENMNGGDSGGKNKAGGNEYIIKRKNIISILFFLIEKCGNINIPDKNGMNPLHYAVLSGNYDLVKELINKKIDINAKDSIKFSTPLILAARIGEWSIVNLLLENNADINILEKEPQADIGPAPASPAAAGGAEPGGAGKNEKDKEIKEEEYLKPVEYNLKFIAYCEGIDNPEKDARSYYQIFIDKQEQGRTSIGLDSQKKEYTALLSVNRHLIEIAKFVLDRKQEKYIRLNNIEQPDPDYFYFNIPEDRIVILSLKRNFGDRKAEFSLSYAKKNETKSEPQPAATAAQNK